MTEPKSRRRLRRAVLVALGVLAVGAAGTATFQAVTGADPKPAAAGAVITPEVGVTPPAATPPSLETETIPSVTTTRAATHHASPTARPAVTSKPAADGEYPPPPQKPLLTASLRPVLSPSYQENVRPGERCAPKGAVGHTADGTLLNCGPGPDNPKDRWQVVIPPPPLPN